MLRSIYRYTPKELRYKKSNRKPRSRYVSNDLVNWAKTLDVKQLGEVGRVKNKKLVC